MGKGIHMLKATEKIERVEESLLGRSEKKSFFWTGLIMTPPPSLSFRWLATYEYPSISYSASFILSFTQVSAKAKKYGLSSLHISLRNLIFSISFIIIPLFFNSLLVNNFWIFAT